MKAIDEWLALEPSEREQVIVCVLGAGWDNAKMWRKHERGMRCFRAAAKLLRAASRSRPAVAK